MPDRIPDPELWRSVERTVREVLLPAIGDDREWARTAAVQLVGLARYASVRPADVAHQRAAELRQVLSQLADNPLVAPLGDDADEGVVLDIAGRALAAAIGRDDEAARQMRDVLRPVLVGQLDDELAITGPLVAAFRGRLDG